MHRFQQLSESHFQYAGVFQGTTTMQFVISMADRRFHMDPFLVSGDDDDAKLATKDQRERDENQPECLRQPSFGPVLSTEVEKGAPI